MNTGPEVEMGYNKTHAQTNYSIFDGYSSFPHYSPLKAQRNYKVMNSNDKYMAGISYNEAMNEFPGEYTEKHLSPLRPSHIISPSKKAPEGYVCVGRVIESPSKTSQITPCQHGMLILNDDAAASRHEFPSSFNPRKAIDMPSKEKVNKWIQNVPLHILGEDILISECYPAVPSSGNNSDACMDYTDTQDILELQCRKITHYATSLYKNESEQVARFNDMIDDEICDSEDNDIHLEDSIAFVENSCDNFFNSQNIEHVNGTQPIEYIINTTL
ncbi:Piso0_000144 [Millerozyma farinosa CBS 7064]|uniref:Piso0_000144 protein n=1 Tax=Pichia sorbitophila (strain ATCC MYA-4447 / BCRC 22081 / CBS 7064 / NBRC 10061 / NRRL Y-12695) TaxID=559304 RepID=G8YT73_PICSO|nr:Piso0_000144 [Millerozyma farinosa CBS 7064]